MLVDVRIALLLLLAGLTSCTRDDGRVADQSVAVDLSASIYAPVDLAPYADLQSLEWGQCPATAPDAMSCRDIGRVCYYGCPASCTCLPSGVWSCTAEPCP